MAKFVITEEQYNKLMEWGADNGTNQTPKEDSYNVDAPNNTAANRAIATNKEIQKSMVTSPTNIRVTSGKTAKNQEQQQNSMASDQTKVTQDCSSSSSSTFESRIITKKELTENHFKHLRNNSKLYTVKDFLSK